MADDVSLGTQECRPLDQSVLNLMRRWQREGALWTSDIAHGVKVKTAKARSSLVRLEAAGKVRRVVTGNPTSWELING